MAGFSAAGPAVEYVSRFTSEREDVVAFFNHVDVPDEIFFQTVLMNSELGESVVTARPAKDGGPGGSSPTYF